jgi:hypothetical protein
MPRFKVGDTIQRCGGEAKLEIVEVLTDKTEYEGCWWIIGRRTFTVENVYIFRDKEMINSYLPIDGVDKHYYLLN